MCLRDTGGTCNIFGCSSKHGDTVCVSGHCLCLFGADESGGVCGDSAAMGNLTLTEVLATRTAQEAWLARKPPAESTLMMVGLASMIVGGFVTTLIMRRKSSSDSSQYSNMSE